MAKVQLTLTDREAKLLSVKANRLGYDLVKYIEHLLSQEAEKVVIVKPPLVTENIEKVAQQVQNDAQAQLQKQGESLTQV